MYCSCNLWVQSTPLKFNKLDLIDCFEQVSVLFSLSCYLCLCKSETFIQIDSFHAGFILKNPEKLAKYPTINVKKTYFSIIFQKFNTQQKGAMTKKHTNCHLSDSVVAKSWLVQWSMWHHVFPTETRPLQTVQKSREKHKWRNPSCE